MRHQLPTRAPPPGRRATSVTALLPALALALVAAGCRDRAVGAGGGDAGADARSPADAGAPADAWVPPEPVYYCPLDATDVADVSGTTPLGPFEGRRAWFGVYGGECGGLSLFVTTDLAAFERVLEVGPYGPMPASTDVLYLGFTSGIEPGADPGTEEADAWVSFWRGGDVQYADTRVILTLRREPAPNDFGPTNAPWLGGRFHVAPDAGGNNAGWDLTGTFSATYCSRTNIYCP